ncbi:MAG TPA: acyl-CoA thioester hydrolase/BAAT C-terminal domain-containing protein [Streptosporangiaceae bacterium]|nr:acyl-CoA thioester hydrolase/BAAT C-terminal domain-containing protein [Streptosporangiaceae bacterium]
MLRAGGATVARTSFGRRLAAARWSTRQETLAADGFAGYLGQPDAGPRRRAAVLLIGGSEGGLPLPLTVALLAGQGYPTLGVAYFGLPGLPSSLADIPLECFARALRWLARQPGVDPARIAVLGVSRGSEAAQLLGVHYPGLVHAVIASVPDNAAACSYPTAAPPPGPVPRPVDARAVRLPGHRAHDRRLRSLRAAGAEGPGPGGTQRAGLPGSRARSCPAPARLPGRFRGSVAVTARAP